MPQAPPARRSGVDPRVAELLAPLSVEEFLDGYYEQRSVCLQQRAERPFAGVFGWRQAEQVLWQNERDLPRLLRVSRDGRHQEPPRTLAESELFRWTIDQFLAGWTVIINELEGLWPEVGALARSLEALARSPVTVNALLTPRGSQAFVPHFDTRDGFILQLAGSKRWRLYGEAERLPLLSQGYVLGPGEVGEVTGEYLLHAGDLLYVPRGVVHAARAEDEDSLHLTLGFRPLRWAELLREALHRIAEEEPELRRHVSGRDLEPGAAGPLIELVLDRLRRERLLAAAWERCEAGFVAALRPLPDGQLAAPVDVELAPDRLLVKRLGAVCRVSAAGEGRVAIVFPGLAQADLAEVAPGAVEGPDFLEPAFRFIAGLDRCFAVRELPGLSPQGQSVLARRLIDEGLLRLHRAGTGS